MIDNCLEGGGNPNFMQSIWTIGTVICLGIVGVGGCSKPLQPDKVGRMSNEIAELHCAQQRIIEPNKVCPFVQTTSTTSTSQP